MSFELTRETYNGLPLIKLAGELMDTDALRLSNELRTASKTPAPTVIVDVSALEYIDSHGLGMLLYHGNELQKAGRRFVIVNENANPRSYISGLLQTTGLTHVIEVRPSRTQI
jgi:anti-anti-sigma factor